MTPERLTDDQRALVTDRILDAAKRCFASRGVEHTDMQHIAVEANVSYETLHQYFPDRDALQTAYSHRQALEVAAEAFSTIHPNDPLDRQLVEVVIAVLRAVRSDPVLAERFGSDNVGAAVAFAHRSEVVRGIAETFFVELSPRCPGGGGGVGLAGGRCVPDHAGRRRTVRTPAAGAVRGPGVRRYSAPHVALTSTSMLNNDTLIVDADSHWCEPPDLFTKLAPAEVQGPRAARRGGRRSKTWVFDGHPLGQASAGAVIARDGHKESADIALNQWSIEDVHVGAYDPKVRLEVLDECGIDAQVIFPNTIGLGGQDLGMVEDDALCRLVIEIYNDGMAEIQAESGNRLLPMPLMPAWDVDHVRRRGQARRRARRARREHDVRPAGPRRARPRQPGVGPVLGGVRRARTCRCTSTSAPASPPWPSTASTRGSRTR